MNNSDKLPFACPNCGNIHVRKSVGGMIEHAAAWGGAKLIKSMLLGDFGGLTGGAENTIIKEEVPFQQVCDYCHYTFHARKSQIGAGKYSMHRSRATYLTKVYNGMLQTMKEKDYKSTREDAFKMISKIFLGILAFLIGLMLCSSSNKYTEGIFGIQFYSWSYMFSWMIMFISGAITVLLGVSCYSLFKKAGLIKRMPLAEYAKDHKAGETKDAPKALLKDLQNPR